MAAAFKSQPLIVSQDRFERCLGRVRCNSLCATRGSLRRLGRGQHTLQSFDEFGGAPIWDQIADIAISPNDVADLSHVK